MLKKYLPSSFGLAHISLTFVGLMWVLPFLYYHHAYPITTFYQEWGAGLLGLCAFPLLLTARYWQAPEVPRIVMLPIGLMLVLMLQFFVGRITHFDSLMLLSLYFLFAALLMMLGQALRAEIGLPTLVTVLAAFLLVGAELNTLAGILQHYRWNTFLNPFVTAKTSSAVYGNTAQPNHYADYLSLGMISLGLLYVQLPMRSWPRIAQLVCCAHAVCHGAIRFAQFLALPDIRSPCWHFCGSGATSLCGRCCITVWHCCWGSA